MLKISICIPTYNGSQTLRATLDSLIGQSIEDMEIVICDDQSRDDTYAIAKEYEAKYPFVKAFQNKDNLGMDRNFTQVVSHATGDFVWFSGQDDIFEQGAIAKFIDITKKYPDVDLVYFNYRFLSGNLDKEVALPPLSLNSDRLFENSAQYFEVFDQAPSFLAATVMRREFWIKTPVEPFWGTHYVQVGVWLQNCRDKKTYVVANPKYISCRIPEDSWKNTGGQMLFEIFSGTLEVYYRTYKTGNGVVPAKLMREMRSKFITDLPNLVIFLGGKGFRLNDTLARRMKYIFGEDRALYFFYVLPLIHLPDSLAALIRFLHSQPLFRAPLRGMRGLLVHFGKLVSGS